MANQNEFKHTYQIFVSDTIDIDGKRTERTMFVPNLDGAKYAEEVKAILEISYKACERARGRDKTAFMRYMGNDSKMIEAVSDFKKKITHKNELDNAKLLTLGIVIMLVFIPLVIAMPPLLLPALFATKAATLALALGSGIVSVSAMFYLMFNKMKDTKDSIIENPKNNVVSTISALGTGNEKTQELSDQLGKTLNSSPTTEPKQNVAEIGSNPLITAKGPANAKTEDDHPPIRPKYTKNDP